MSATGRPCVVLVLPTGRRHALETWMRPQIGEVVTLAALSYRVRAVTCVFDAIDGEQDHLLVTLGGL